VKIYHVIQIKFNQLVISKSFTHKMPGKPAGIDMKRNYVTVILCIPESGG